MPEISEEQKQQDQRLAEKMAQVKNKIFILSGKGGVGKSTVAVNLAYALALEGSQVGLMDVDVHGPNIAKMLGIEDKTLTGSQQAMEPVEVIPGLKAVSLALAGNDADTPFIWRGPLKTGLIRQFLADVEWGPLDYLIVDTPPGTGDEPLSAIQNVPEPTGGVIVTTPQDVALLDSRKSVNFARKLDLPVLGIVENMSGFACPHCGKEIPIFGKGGGEKAAQEMGVPFLGALPLDPAVVVSGDQGRPFSNGDGEPSPVTEAARGVIARMREIIRGRKGRPAPGPGSEVRRRRASSVGQGASP